MFATAISMLVAGILAAGVINEVVLPAGEYAIEKGTEAYNAGKELYQEKVVDTEAYNADKELYQEKVVGTE